MQTARSTGCNLSVFKVSTRSNHEPFTNPGGPAVIKQVAAAAGGRNTGMEVCFRPVQWPLVNQVVWRQAVGDSPMQRVASAILLSILTLPVVVPLVSGQEKPPTPAEQFAALKQEYDKVPGARAPASDEERLQLIGRVYKHHFAVARKLVKLAVQHPKDPIALDALMLAVWQVNTTPWPVELVGEDAARARAFELIQQGHLGSDRLGPLCQRVSWGFCREYETFLRAVLAQSPHQGVQATASLALARFLNNRLLRVELCQEPNLAREFGGLYGRDYLAELQRRNRDQVHQEIEAILVQVAQKYADVKLPDGEEAAERANAELFGIRSLSVGKEAPDIAGEDEAGKPFKLSDYRGKVVLVDFWSYV